MVWQKFRIEDIEVSSSRLVIGQAWYKSREVEIET